ncbi:MAG: M20/M25/M40 family metallo-hydrolase, partial [Gemmatimonadaceae bacterium]|nr:M20/M25/M40 family metallo-hydrolase [Gemmatimonadaceae bacterium]
MQTAPPPERTAPFSAATLVRSLAASRERLALCDATTLERQLAIARIPAPLGGEDARSRWLAERFAALGLDDVRSDGEGNLIVRIAGEADLEPVAVLSHMDTVFTSRVPAEVVRTGDRFTGPGINDNARGLAAMLAIAAELAGGEVQPRRSVLLVATTGEEGAGDLRGAKHFFGTHPRVTAAIALDGAGDDRIVNAALGSRRLHIAFDGPGGHSWSAHGVANAVNAAAACTARLARLAMPAGPRATLSVGRIGGGESINAIPAHAWLEVDARSADAATLTTVERDIRRVVSAVVDEENRHRAPGTPPLSATVQRFGDRPSGLTPASHPLVAAAMEIIRELGCEPRLAVASTDANIPMSLGIPAIAIGAGGIGGNAHTDQEWYENVEG